MTEARTVAASPPKVLTGAVHLRALEVDDWVVEQQLSRDRRVRRTSARGSGGLLRTAADGAWTWCRHRGHSTTDHLAFAHGYPQVALETIEGNVASERVAQRAGFTRTDRHEDEHRREQVVVTRWLKHPSAATQTSST